MTSGSTGWTRLFSECEADRAKRKVGSDVMNDCKDDRLRTSKRTSFEPGQLVRFVRGADFTGTASSPILYSRSSVLGSGGLAGPSNPWTHAQYLEVFLLLDIVMLPGELGSQKMRRWFKLFRCATSTVWWHLNTGELSVVV